MVRRPPTRARARASIVASPPRTPRTTPTSSLSILIVASELQPFSNTGGLAAVAGALPRALARLGHEVTVITPRYRGIGAGTRREQHALAIGEFAFDVGYVEHEIGERARVVFVDCPPLFDREGIYTERGVDYRDNALRFAVLSAAAVDWTARQPTLPSVVHAHDWQTGLVPLYLRTRLPRQRPADTIPPSVFTIHSLAYQGVFEKAWVPRLEIGWDAFTPAGAEYWDQVSFMKAGLNLSDVVTTVSPTYAQEIQRPEHGYGLDGVVRGRADAVVGILNGIDTEAWNPAADPHLPEPFSLTEMAGKAAAKRALLEAFGLNADGTMLRRPIVGLVSRMVDQKGFDLIDATAGRLAELDATFVLLGRGDPRYEDLWRRLAAERPAQFAAVIGVDERLAHLVEAGSDIFLMPSRFEPCGLNQMYSLRYGTVPVVRAVGGLVDTVRPYRRQTGHGTGFLFSDYHPEAMLAALGAALATFAVPKAWQRLQRNGMAKDFSWDQSATEYVRVYKRVIGAHRTAR